MVGNRTRILRDGVATFSAMFAAIRSARDHVNLEYYVVEDVESEDLIAGARRGADVRLLLPGQSDSDLAFTVGRSYYRQLLEGGVKILETRNEVLHSKVAVVDGVWTIIGSSNFDRRSALFNDEVDSVVLGRETGQQIEAMFEDDFTQATAIELATWKDRPLPTKIKEILYATWQNQL